MGIGLVWRRKLTRTGIWLPLFPDLHGNVPLCSNIKVFTGSFAPERDPEQTSKGPKYDLFHLTNVHVINRCSINRQNHVPDHHFAN